MRLISSISAGSKRCAPPLLVRMGCSGLCFLIESDVDFFEAQIYPRQWLVEGACNSLIGGRFGDESPALILGMNK